VAAQEALLAVPLAVLPVLHLLRHPRLTTTTLRTMTPRKRSPQAMTKRKRNPPRLSMSLPNTTI
jgi:hypothetical protein